MNKTLWAKVQKGYTVHSQFDVMSPGDGASEAGFHVASDTKSYPADITMTPQSTRGSTTVLSRGIQSPPTSRPRPVSVHSTSSTTSTLVAEDGILGSSIGRRPERLKPGGRRIANHAQSNPGSSYIPPSTVALSPITSTPQSFPMRSLSQMMSMNTEPAPAIPLSPHGSTGASIPVFVPHDVDATSLNSSFVQSADADVPDDLSMDISALEQVATLSPVRFPGHDPLVIFPPSTSHSVETEISVSDIGAPPVTPRFSRSRRATVNDKATGNDVRSSSSRGQTLDTNNSNSAGPDTTPIDAPIPKRRRLTMSRIGRLVLFK